MQTPFHLACKYGYPKIANFLIQKAIELKKDVNTLCHIDGFHNSKKILNIMNGFHFACKNGHSDIVEMIILKADEIEIDLNAKAIHGNKWYSNVNDKETAFHLACENGHFKTVEIIILKSAEFNIDLNAKNNSNHTGFHYGKSIF